MPPIQIKLIQTPVVRLITFGRQPSWTELALRIEKLFNIRIQDVAVSYIDRDGDRITVTTTEELIDCFENIHNSTGTLRLTVFDIRALRAHTSPPRFDSPPVVHVRDVGNERRSRPRTISPISFHVEDNSPMYPCLTTMESPPPPFIVNSRRRRSSRSPSPRTVFTPSPSPPEVSSSRRESNGFFDPCTPPLGLIPSLSYRSPERLPSLGGGWSISPSTGYRRGWSRPLSVISERSRSSFADERETVIVQPRSPGLDRVSRRRSRSAAALPAGPEEYPSEIFDQPMLHRAQHPDPSRASHNEANGNLKDEIVKELKDHLAVELENLHQEIILSLSLMVSQEMSNCEADIKENFKYELAKLGETLRKDVRDDAEVKDPSCINDPWAEIRGETEQGESRERKEQEVQVPAKVRPEPSVFPFEAVQTPGFAAERDGIRRRSPEWVPNRAPAPPVQAPSSYLPHYLPFPPPPTRHSPPHLGPTHDSSFPHPAFPRPVSPISTPFPPPSEHPWLYPPVSPLPPPPSRPSPPPSYRHRRQRPYILPPTLDWAPPQPSPPLTSDNMVSPVIAPLLKNHVKVEGNKRPHKEKVGRSRQRRTKVWKHRMETMPGQEENEELHDLGSGVRFADEEVANGEDEVVVESNDELYVEEVSGAESQSERSMRMNYPLEKSQPEFATSVPGWVYADEVYETSLLARRVASKLGKSSPGMDAIRREINEAPGLDEDAILDRILKKIQEPSSQYRNSFSLNPRLSSTSLPSIRTQAQAHVAPRRRATLSAKKNWRISV